MRPARGVVVVFWSWMMVISLALFSLMVYAGVLDGLGRALYDLVKDILIFLLD